MGIDSSMFQNVDMTPVMSPQNALMQAYQLHGMQRQNALADSQIADQQAKVKENALARGLLPKLDLNNPEHQQQLLSVAPNVGTSLLTARAKWQQDQGAANKSNADAADTTAKTRMAAIDRHLQQIPLIKNPQLANQWLAAAVTNGAMTQQQATYFMQNMPQDGAQVPQYLQGLQEAGLTNLQQIGQREPKPVEVTAGATKFFRDTAPGSPTFMQQLGATVPMTQTLDSAAGNATTRRGQDIAAQTARDGHLIASGMSMPGQNDDNFERTAQAVASGQLAPPSGMALTNPKNQRLLGRVMEINPKYDFTDVTAKKTAAAAFTSGKEGAAMRSFAVAGQHLEQLGQLADALGNGNIQVINKVSQAIAQQTGSEAPTNFDATKQIVAKEVVKAIVAGGGGVEERKAMEETLSRAKSPSQLKGVITQFSNLMAAQHDALLQQRRAAGLSDSTLPVYRTPKAAPAAAGGSTDLGNGFILNN